VPLERAASRAFCVTEETVGKEVWRFRVGAGEKDQQIVTESSTRRSNVAESVWERDMAEGSDRGDTWGACRGGDVEEISPGVMRDGATKGRADRADPDDASARPVDGLWRARRECVDCRRRREENTSAPRITRRRDVPCRSRHARQPARGASSPPVWRG